MTSFTWFLLGVLSFVVLLFTYVKLGDIYGKQKD